MTTELEFEPCTSLDMRRKMKDCANDFKEMLEGFQEFLSDITTNLLL